jgi:glutamine synthetase
VNADDIVRRVEEEGLAMVRFLWCGNDGTIRGKASGRHGLRERLVDGIGLTKGMYAMNVLDQLQPVEGMGPVGEVRLVPDLDTFRVLPYAPGTGALLVDQTSLDGTPAPACPRSFLRRMATALADRGAELLASFENEFSLAVEVDGGWAPLDESLCFSTTGATAAQDYVAELVEALAAQGIELAQYYPELGPGQQEVSVPPEPVLRAADEQILVRETIRAAATGQGLVASLAPKPWPAAAGNGAHVHFSLWDPSGGRNRFHDSTAPDRLSREARAFIAGVLEHLPGLCGLTAPSFDSYRRIQPAMWAGAFACWGPDNREAPVRVPSTFRSVEAASTNVELKSVDASANPYLALGGLVAAGIDGLARGLEPPPPLAEDPGALGAAERERLRIVRLPESQAQALDALEADPLLMDALGGPLATAYLAVRRSEWAAFSGADEESIQRGHFAKY